MAVIKSSPPTILKQFLTLSLSPSRVTVSIKLSLDRNTEVSSPYPSLINVLPQTGHTSEKFPLYKQFNSKQLDSKSYNEMLLS